MRILDLPFTTTDWSSVEPTEHAGERGLAYWRTQNVGDVRVRMVEYTPGYLADHWCRKGHILFVTAGALSIEHQDGRRYELSMGMSYDVPDDDTAPHRLTSDRGASVFIVD